MPMLNQDHPLRPITSAWLKKIKLAHEYKVKKFADDADECLNFYNGPHDFQYFPKYATSSKGFVLGDSDDLPDPSFRMTVNKVAEMVQIYGPVLYSRNPVRKVNPRKIPIPPPQLFGQPDDPNVQMAYMQILQQAENMRAIDQGRAVILEWFLNYTPTELGLKDEARAAIDEALIKGMGVLWTELYQPKGSNVRLVGSFYDSVDNLLIDPDMETIQDAWWIARRCVHPYWQVEQEYGLPPNSLRDKANLESYNQQATTVPGDVQDYDRKRGMNNDLLVYWKIYSKMGIGARLSGVPKEYRDTLDMFGDYCYIVVADGVPYPLNLPSAVLGTLGDQEVLQRLEWPTPFWAANEWPFTDISFHPIPRQVWPMSHIKPGLGELKFINWAYSFLAGKIRTTCRDFIVARKSASEEMKDAILNGKDLTLLEIEHQHGTINEVVQFLQHPQMQGDIWKVIEAVEHNFELRVGLTELMYGQTGSQMRSAEEANVKSNQLNVRPDDMAQKVEDAMSIVARKEAIAARWHLTNQDVAPLMGPIGAQFWQQLLMGSDIYEIVHQLDYRIEASSAKKPNKALDAANLQQGMTVLLPILQQVAMASGQVGPINALISDWAQSVGMDASKYLLPPPPPPPPMPPPGAAPPPQQAPAGRNGHALPPPAPKPVGGPPK